MVNTVAAVVSAIVAILTLLDQRRSRQSAVAVAHRSADPARATSGTAAIPGRSGKATAALVFGLWGLIGVGFNRSGVGAPYEFLAGLAMSLAALPLAIWAMYNIRTNPRSRGLWLAVVGLVAGVAGILVVLAGRNGPGPTRWM
jgi:hypothetical protein